MGVLLTAVVLFLVALVTARVLGIGQTMRAHVAYIVYMNLVTLPLRLTQIVLSPILALLVNHKTERFYRPFDVLLYPFGNNEDGMVGDHPFRTISGRCKWCNFDTYWGRYWASIQWQIRNAAHNALWGWWGFAQSEIEERYLMGGNEFAFFPDAYRELQKDGLLNFAYHWGAVLRKGRRYPEFYLAIGRLHIRSGWRATSRIQDGKPVRIRFVTSIKWL